MSSKGPVGQLVKLRGGCLPPRGRLTTGLLVGNLPHKSTKPALFPKTVKHLYTNTVPHPSFGIAAHVSRPSRSPNGSNTRVPAGPIPSVGPANVRSRVNLPAPFHLKQRSGVVYATGVCHAIEVAARILDQTANGIGAVRPARERMQHRLVPAYKIQNINGPVGLRSSAASGAVNIAIEPLAKLKHEGHFLFRGGPLPA